jgi:hypothetical protein
MAELTPFPGRTNQVHRKRKPVTCTRCGYTWVPYGRKRPRHCANRVCHSPYWDRPKRQFHRAKGQP